MNDYIDVFKWSDFAACRDVEPEEFFPLTLAGEVKAKAICEGCPVRDICRDFALGQGLDHGIFGGLTADERRAYKQANAHLFV